METERKREGEGKDVEVYNEGEIREEGEWRWGTERVWTIMRVRMDYKPTNWAHTEQRQGVNLHGV